MKAIEIVNDAPGQWDRHEGRGRARRARRRTALSSRKGVISAVGAEMLLDCSVALVINGGNNDRAICRNDSIPIMLAGRDL
jgi:hypothetical protein